MTQSLSSGRSVVVDNTNASAATRAPLIRLARAHGAQVTGYCFPTEAAAALRRNRVREGRQRVPDVAIFAVLEPPSVGKGFDRLFTVELIEVDRRFAVTPYST